ncbi:AraC family transcriptional regulator, partial [Staphylococcus aureus]|nr:AraC family transcriptional regulator [Staphylococcus aureus]
NKESETSVAKKNGYSIDGFTNSYRDWSGYLPSQIYEKQVLNSYPKLSLAINFKGGIGMKTRIVDLPKIKIVGVKKRVRM